MSYLYNIIYFKMAYNDVLCERVKFSYYPSDSEVKRYFREKCGDVAVWSRSTIPARLTKLSSGQGSLYDSMVNEEMDRLSDHLQGAGFEVRTKSYNDLMHKYYTQPEIDGELIDSVRKCDEQKYDILHDSDTLNLGDI